MVKTVPAMVSRSAAVAAPESSAQSAMSPAPTRTGSPDADGAADAEPAAALAIAWLVAAGVCCVTLVPKVAPGLPADRLTRLANPNSRIRVALKATTPSPTDRAIVRGPSGRGSSLIGRAYPRASVTVAMARSKRSEAALRSNRSKFPAA